jgi:uncharacterized protein YjgD (DUF1641 family)
MAKPLPFTPKSVDFQLDLERRLREAPREHAEALLVLFDTIQAAHDKGILDAVHGMLFARDAIAEKLAELANTPEGESGIRNLLQSAKLVAAVDPDLLERFTNAFAEAESQHKLESTPPSAWQLFKRAVSEDGRRGISFATLVLTSLGRSLKS